MPRTVIDACADPAAKMRAPRKRNASQKNGHLRHLEPKKQEVLTPCIQWQLTVAVFLARPRLSELAAVASALSVLLWFMRLNRQRSGMICFETGCDVSCGGVRQDLDNL